MNSNTEARYLAFGDECVRISQCAPNNAQRIMLLHIAETWLRLAQSVREESLSGRTLH
jgi:hypothetical protein